MTFLARMSKILDDSHLLKRLSNLGLQEKESRVYLALLPCQNVGTSMLIRATGLHGQFVYSALERLEALGLAKHVVERGRKKFSANPPQRLLALVDEKRLTAQAIAQELEHRFSGAHQQDFEIFQGESAFVGHEFRLLEEMPESSTVSVIGGGGSSYVNTIGAKMEEYERLRNAKNIRVRYISSAGQSASLIKMAKTRRNFEYRIFPHLEKGFVDTDIWPDKVVLNFFGTPLLSFTLTNREIAGSYLQFFEALWQTSIENVSPTNKRTKRTKLK